MRNQIEGFIAPLSTEPDTAYREYLLNTMLIILIGASVLFESMTVVLWATGQASLTTVVAGIALLLIYLAAYRFSRRQRITLGTYLTVGTLFLTIFMITAFSGIGHPNMLGFAIVAMMAAILLGMKIALFSVLLIVVAYGLCGYAQVTGNLPYVMPQDEAWLMDLTGLGIGLLSLALFGRLATRMLNSSLRRERDLTAKLMDQSSHLEELVVQRTEKLTRVNTFLSALSQIAARVGISADVDQILTTLDGELKKFGLDYFFVMLDPDTDQLKARYLSIEPHIMHIAEKMAGITFQNFRLSLGQWPGWAKIKNGHGVCFTDPAEAVVDIFPKTPLPILRPIMEMVGAGAGTAMIFLPLQVEQRTTGILAVWGKNLTEDDVSTLAIFANQVAVTLEKNRLYQETALLKRFSESIVQGVAEPILIEGVDGKFTFANAEIENLLGYSPQEIIGKHWTLIVAEGDQETVHTETARRVEGVSSRYEVNLLHKTGGLVPVIVSASPMFVNDEYVGTLAAISDITERKQAEAQIKASLREKEVLLQEIHHRVKNNLQVIASLLSLQSGYIEHPQALEVFKESEQRIRSMALIHEKLYRSENLARIDLAEYINDLSASLFRAHQAASRGIKLTLHTRRVLLGIDTAVPCGLILNELISNVLKHAFPLPNKVQDGEVLIGLDFSAGKVSLRVADNGVGFPEHIDFRQSTSLGLRIVNLLVDQLDGTIKLSNQRGTEFQITFFAEIYNQE